MCLQLSAPLTDSQVRREAYIAAVALTITVDRRRLAPRLVPRSTALAISRGTALLPATPTTIAHTAPAGARICGR